MFLNLLQSKWFMMISLTILILLGISVYKKQPMLNLVQQEEKYADEKIEELRYQKEKLEEGKTYFQSGAYIEQQARIKLNYQKPGEHVVYVYHQSPVKTEVSPSASTSLNFFQRWWYNLTHK